ncbi:hypothetical protein WA158_000515 [Blastocystis sp. Blastoise]
MLRRNYFVILLITLALCSGEGFKNPKCTFKGIECSDGKGIPYPDDCTNFYISCKEQKSVDVKAVQSGMKCYKGGFVASNRCGHQEEETCEFNGLRCYTKNGVRTVEETQYYRYCENEKLSTLLKTSNDYVCRNDRLVYTGNCPECSFEGIQCVDNLAEIVTGECTDRYVMCSNGKLTDPMAVAKGTQCKDGELVGYSECPDTQNLCTFEGIHCSDVAGNYVENQCTAYYRMCEEGTLSIVEPVAEGTKCYNNEIVSAASCSSSECSFEGIKCVNDDSVVVVDTCTDWFVECDAGGLITEKQPVAPGTKCRNNVLITTEECEGGCVEEEIKCVDCAGNIITGSCTNYFAQCTASGAYTEPEIVPLGTQCKDGVLINTDECAATNCTFTGIKCVTDAGVQTVNTCTDHYITCSNGVNSDPMPVAAGTKCYNGEQILASACPHSDDCVGEGIYCVTEDGSIAIDTCTDEFVTCYNGGYSVAQPVAPGTKCYNGELVPQTECSGVECNFEGIKCIDNNGVITTTTCTTRYVQCTDGILTIAMPIAEGTRCYNGKQINVADCECPECAFTGIKCVNTDGIVVTDECTDKYVMCDNGVLTDPLPVAEGTQCKNGILINAETCSSAGCDWEGIKCVDSDNMIVTDKCTDRFVQCEYGVTTAPVYVPLGTQCKNGELINSYNCTGDGCSYEGIHCANDDGVYVTNTCTDYFRTCEVGGIESELMPVAEGTKCYNNMIINAEDCGCPECSYTGIICVHDDGTYELVECTSKYKTCVEGVESDPILVAEGTQCRAGTIIREEECTNCCFKGIKCVNDDDVIVTGECTNKYIECVDGFQTDPLSVPPGSKCKDGEFVLESECGCPECTYEGIKCVNDEGIIVTDVCTSKYVECVDGKESDPLPVAPGSKCLNNEIVLESECGCPECTYEGIKCVNDEGVIVADVCTSKYVECVDGKESDPLPVAPGSKCLNNEIVLESQCGCPECTYEGFKCVNEEGIVVTDVCTDKYVECVDGKESDPLPVAPGSKCLNSEFVLESQCGCPDCDYEGIKCVNDEGTVITDECTSKYIECVNGKETDPLPVADGSKCKNGEIILESECTTVECEYEGIKCVDENGVYIEEVCVDNYVQCVEGIETDPILVETGSKCKNDEIILESQCGCPDCNYEGIKCVNDEGTVVTDECTSRYVECDNGVETDPLPVAAGSKCKNGEIILESECTTPECDYEGYKCVNNKGEVIVDKCTNRYVECNNGVETDPLPVAPGTKCLNGNFILPRDCNNPECDYEGIQCVKGNGEIVIDECTNKYAECVDGIQSNPQNVPEGSKCLNGEIVLESACSDCECSWEGIHCVKKDGTYMEDTCTDYFTECADCKETKPSPVAEGTKCLNNEIVLASACNGEGCVTDTISCISDSGALVTDMCTSRYVECLASETWSSPMPVAPGSKCYNGMQISAEDCCIEGSSCTFVGFRCVDSNNVVVSNVCTENYAICDAGVVYIRPMPENSLCFNNVAVPEDECSPCLNTGKGLRGKNAPLLCKKAV